jgi:hypothetical protein
LHAAVVDLVVKFNHGPSTGSYDFRRRNAPVYAAAAHFLPYYMSLRLPKIPENSFFSA